MIGVVRFAYLLALGLWLGEVVFFSFVVAPTLFAVLGPTRAGEVTSALFPTYYAFGFGAATVAIATALILRSAARGRAWWTASLVALAVGLAATAWASLVVHPRAQEARALALAADQAPAESPLFRSAHRQAVVLNAAALAAGIAGLGLSAAGLRE